MYEKEPPVQLQLYTGTTGTGTGTGTGTRGHASTVSMLFRPRLRKHKTACVLHHREGLLGARVHIFVGVNAQGQLLVPTPHVCLA